MYPCDMSKVIEERQWMNYRNDKFQFVEVNSDFMNQLRL